MLTGMRVRNFKKFRDVTIELGKTVVFIGPNNSGKTTALQALALWEIGLKKWNERWQGKPYPEKRPGVTINRRDVLATPVSDTSLFWNGRRVRSVAKSADGKPQTQNIRIEIVVEGVTGGKSWSCGLEFDYANEESFYCRPLGIRENGEVVRRLPVPPEAANVHIAYLPPMSGLASSEPRLDWGYVQVLLGEGQTAQVLRNLCYRVCEQSPEDWRNLVEQIRRLFGVTLHEPKYNPARGQITMTYEERHTELDLSAAGRGLQQMLLLFAYLYANPKTVLLLDEPDAHLEVLRQREVYAILTEIAEKTGSQIIAASHSEVLLNEAAGRDTVVAFVGRPHRIDGRGSQVLKSLREIRFDHYYQAEQTGWVLYLEGSTDLAVLQVFAEKLNHPAAAYLRRPFVHYVGNQLSKALDHFYGLREAKRDLVGIAILDRDEGPESENVASSGRPLRAMRWRRREIENYFCDRDVLLAYAEGTPEHHDLFDWSGAERRRRAMEETVEEITGALRTLKEPDPWSPDAKASEFLDRVFERYFEKLGLPNIMRKTDYHTLASLLPAERIDPEVAEKLDAIVEVASSAVVENEEP